MREPLKTTSRALAALALSLSRAVAQPTATASTESAEHPAAAAVDGDRGTRWSSPLSEPHVLITDFGEQKRLVGVILLWEAAHAFDYAVEVSIDGRQWQPAYSTSSGDGGLDDIDFAETPVRYLKLLCNRRATAWGFSLFEVIPKTVAEPWGEGEPGGFFLKRAWEIAADPDGSSWHRNTFHIPADWADADPFIQLADVRGAFELFINGEPAPGGAGPQKKCRIGLRDHLLFGGTNAIAIKVAGPGDGKAALRSVLLAAGDRPLADGLQALRRRDANEYFRALAHIEPEGRYPIWMSGRQGYWTVVGVDGDLKESLLCEDGTVEPYKSFSISPFLWLDGQLITRADVEIEQTLDAGFLPVPSVTWRASGLKLRVKAFADGPPGMSTTYLRYTVENDADRARAGKLYLVARPFEVNPPWQWGGFTRIRGVAYQAGRVRINEYELAPLTPPAGFGVTSSRDGDIMACIEQGVLPDKYGVQDPEERAAAALQYDFNLEPGASACFILALPLYPESLVACEGRPAGETAACITSLWKKALHRWHKRLTRVPFAVPDEDITKTLKASLAYILVNRDGPAIQPGSRAYEASWMRDGAMTSAALLRLGLSHEVRAFLDWYGERQFEDGRVPAIVVLGRNEVNPVKEYDSQGQFVHACLEYYRFTGDKVFLQGKWPSVRRALEYLEHLRDQEVREELLNDPQERRYYGILPKSVSHEGYYPEPGNHSYWDDFWALRGWKDGAAMAELLDKPDDLAWIRREEQELREAVGASIRAAMDHYRIDYIPGCAELGDFDPSSTVLAVNICDETAVLPGDALKRTLDRYLENFRKRKEPGWEGSFSPYEIRIVEAVLRLDRKDDALEVLDFMMLCRHPRGWRQWPEAVYFPPSTPGYIGDMPHTWVASGFIDTVRAMLVYERESDGALVAGAGIPESWLEEGRHVAVQNGPTRWGAISLAFRRAGDQVLVTLGGPAAPPGGVVLKSPLSSPIRAATINGSPAEEYSGTAVRVRSLPAEVVLSY